MLEISESSLFQKPKEFKFVPFKTLVKDVSLGSHKCVSVILLLYFVVFPMGILLYDSIMVNGAINFGNYADVYSQDVNWRALSNTVQLSLLVMVASVIITFPLAWLVGRTDMPGKKTYRTLLVASYMIPPYVGAIAWVQLLNPSVGYLNSIFKWILQLQQSPFDIYTMGGLAWVLTLFYSPFAFITISRAMEKMDPTLEIVKEIIEFGNRPAHSNAKTIFSIFKDKRNGTTNS